MPGTGTVAPPTASVVEPQSEPSQALSVAIPSATPKALPRSLESLLTAAIELFEVLQVTDANLGVLLSLKVPVALKV
jgi:hypothetical protein